MKIYQSIDTLPIYRFNKIIESENMAYLIKGDADYVIMEKIPASLNHVWQFILNQYHEELAKTRKRNVKLDVIKQTYKLRIDKYIIKNELLCFSMSPDEKHIKALQRYGYLIDKKKMSTYQERMVQVNEINRRLSIFDAKIKVLSREIEEDKESQGEAMTFDELVVIASKHMGRYIDVFTTSVREWIAIENNLLKAAKNGKDKE